MTRDRLNRPADLSLHLPNPQATAPYHIQIKHKNDHRHDHGDHPTPETLSTNPQNPTPPPHQTAQSLPPHSSHMPGNSFPAFRSPCSAVTPKPALRTPMQKQHTGTAVASMRKTQQPSTSGPTAGPEPWYSGVLGPGASEGRTPAVAARHPRTLRRGPPPRASHFRGPGPGRRTYCLRVTTTYQSRRQPQRRSKGSSSQTVRGEPVAPSQPLPEPMITRLMIFAMSDQYSNNLLLGHVTVCLSVNPGPVSG